jgi:hypothetical protein
MPQEMISDPKKQASERDTRALFDEKQVRLLTFDDLVVDGSIVPVSVRLIQGDVEHQPSQTEANLMTDLQCEV